MAYGDYTRKEVEKMAEDLARTKKRISSMKEKATEMVGTTIGIAETSGAGFGVAYFRGRFEAKKEKFEIGGLPIDLVIAGAGHLLAFSGLFGKYGEHVHNVATGALTTYAAFEGYNLGIEAGRSAAPAFGGQGMPRRSHQRLQNAMPHNNPFMSGIGQAAAA